jgi:membrane fusion protein (multidrug efflux system)
VETKTNALLVPQRAAVELQGQYQLYVVGTDDTAQIRPVTLGERVGNLWLVEKGLEPGERVIVEGIQRVRAGAPVAPRTVTPPPESAGESPPSSPEPGSDSASEGGR